MTNMLTDTFEIADHLVCENDVMTHHECVWVILQRVPELTNIRDYILSVEGTSVTVHARPNDLGSRREVVDLIWNAIGAS
jgi:hypothetical protein